MLRMWVALVLGLALHTPALAAECPWAGAERLEVSVSRAHVWVNDESYRVAGRHNRLEFADILKDCNAPRAAKYFADWRGLRRASNTWIGVGVLSLPLAMITWPAWPAAIVTSLIGTKSRERMVDALLASTPPGVEANAPLYAVTAPHFRDARWGMTPDQVRILETATLLSETDTRLVYGEEVAGLRMAFMYEFEDGRLVRGKYLSREVRSDPEANARDYLTLRKLLWDQYGSAAKNTIAGPRPFPSAIGAAVVAGTHQLHARWETADTTIVLALIGDGDRATLTVEYLPREGVQQLQPAHDPSSSK
ncbi:MAG: hypothetical protein JRJ84_07530 [Deltaproteobacteria bacterium]|nr:hypothetical protein [Deltaproteobacteria bacterium]